MLTSRYEQEARSLINTLERNGATILGVDDGMEYIPHGTCHAAETIISVDESHLRVKLDGRTLVLFLVIGNDPGELVCDHTDHPALRAITAEHFKRWDR